MRNKKHKYEDIILICSECGHKEYIKDHGNESIVISSFEYFEKKHKRDIRTINGHRNMIHCECGNNYFLLDKKCKLMRINK